MCSIRHRGRSYAISIEASCYGHAQRQERQYVTPSLLFALGSWKLLTRLSAYLVSSFHPSGLLHVTVTPEAVLSDIHLVRVVDQVEFVAFWHTLNEWLTEHPKVSPAHPLSQIRAPHHAYISSPVRCSFRANGAFSGLLQVNLIVIDTLSFHLRDPQIPAATKRRLIDL